MIFWVVGSSREILSGSCGKLRSKVGQEGDYGDKIPPLSDGWLKSK